MSESPTDLQNVIHDFLLTMAYDGYSLISTKIAVFKSKVGNNVFQYVFNTNNAPISNQYNYPGILCPCRNDMQVWRKLRTKVWDGSACDLCIT